MWSERTELVVVLDHDERVAEVLVASVVVAGHALGDGEHDAQHDEGAPQALHADHDERGGVVAGHDLLLQDELRRHDGAPEKQHRDALGHVGASGGIEEGGASDDDDCEEVEHDAHPIVAVELLLQKEDAVDGDEDDGGGAHELVNGHLDVEQAHHGARRAEQVSDGGGNEDEQHLRRHLGEGLVGLGDLVDNEVEREGDEHGNEHEERHHEGLGKLPGVAKGVD